MRQILSLLISVSLFSSGLAFAQTAPQMVDIKQTQPFSIIYSATEGRALVGTLDSGGKIASFADCVAPHGEPAASLAVKDVTDCKEIPESRFVYTEEYAQRINGAFPGVLRALYADKYRGDAARANGPNELLFLVTMIGGFSFTILYGTSMVNSFRGGAYFKGAGNAIGVAVGAAVTAVSVGLLYLTDQNVSGHATVPSLESQLIESLRKATVKSSALVGVDFNKSSYILSFELLREAIVDSIVKANTL